MERLTGRPFAGEYRFAVRFIPEKMGEDLGAP
jgi:hypothetical protein